MERQSNGSEGSTFLHVAITINNVPELCKLDISLPMEKIVQTICEKNQIQRNSFELGLWTNDNDVLEGSRYISDENKDKVPPGSILVLKESPTKIVESLIINLHNDKTLGLQLIAEESGDSVVLDLLTAFGVHENVFKAMYEVDDAMNWSHGLLFLYRLYTKRKIRRIPMSIISRLLKYVSNGFEYPSKLVHQSLQMLVVIRRIGRLRYQKELFDHLSTLLMARQEPHLQEASLQLLNYLVIFPNNPEEEKEALDKVVNQKIVGCICDHVLRGKPSLGMEKQLFLYQTLLFRPYWHKKVEKTPVSEILMHSVEMFTEENDKTSRMSMRRRVCSEGDESRSPTPDSPKPKTFMGNLKSSLRRHRHGRRNRKGVRSIVDARSTPSPTSSNTSAETVLPRVFAALSPKNIRKSPLFQSCYVPTSAPEKEKPLSISDVRFEFPGTINYVKPLVGFEKVLKKSASFSDFPCSKAFFENTRQPKKETHGNFKEISKLTADNLKYQAKHYAARHTRWIEKGRNFEVADQLTHALCRLLEVGKVNNVDNIGDHYHPLAFFVYPFFLEEIFCEALPLFERTSKEMRAQDESDYRKVMNVLEEQLKCALLYKGSQYREELLSYQRPKSVKDFHDNLSRITYQHVSEKQKVLREERLAVGLKTKPLFLAHREKLKPEILKLIEKQRWRFIQDGVHLPKFSNKGELQKNKEEFIGLNKNKDQLILGSCDISPRKCHHTRTLYCEDIVDMGSGKTSKFYKDVFSLNEQKLIKTQNDNWNFLFTLKMKEDIYHNFCAPDKKSLDYLTDVFHLILGKPMKSESLEREMKMFLDLEVRLRFLAVEEIPIPDTPPPVPPLPENLDYCRPKQQAKKVTTKMLNSTYCK